MTSAKGRKKMIRKPLESESLDCIKLLYQSGEHMFSYFLAERIPQIYRCINVFHSQTGTLFSRENMLVKIIDDHVSGMILSVAIKDMKQMEKTMARHGFALLKTVGLLTVLKILFRSRLQKTFEVFQQEDEYYIANVAVVEEHRGQGIGWELLQSAEAIARQKGFKKLSLAVEFYNTGAKRLYERYGFVEEAKVSFPKRYHKYDIDGFDKMVKVLIDDDASNGE
ncbi:MAG: GNAT family N-acetyltransferase [Bacillus subtilis]|nr:GNAT family N-acetyltransferase [Bacillus subtilis]